ncbi:Nif11-like leader peptide family natural product precursor [Leptothoe spongobia]|uniref:Nif11-like leader peptide family natural product n=1 Tax=Leptothoe spongobia TAU-MAC 1115 TaxID=1967444 RepID=A0A947DET3_9CYAN|nr:Nif11-like leader peptide family natural product precursor [Leptothoe spongobia]MBT9315787.1 Nif11-like leader peptide family natural product precursor [Leptothoe spongobia TAU-MAC 1115]
MLNQLKALLSNAQLRQQLKAANSLVDAIALLKAAGTEKGYTFSNKSLSQIISTSNMYSKVRALSEADLLAIAGADGPPESVVTCTDVCEVK